MGCTKVQGLNLIHNCELIFWSPILEKFKAIKRCGSGE